MTTDKCLVLAGDLTGTKEGVHSAESSVSAGENYEAGGIHAQSVDDHFVHSAGFGTELVKDGLVQGGVRFVLSWNSEDAGWLADNDNVLILENNVKALSW